MIDCFMFGLFCNIFAEILQVLNTINLKECNGYEDT